MNHKDNHEGGVQDQDAGIDLLQISINGNP
jgi:hypothetical protein